MRRRNWLTAGCCVGSLVFCLFGTGPSFSSVARPSQDRPPDALPRQEGEGPFSHLVLRGLTLIDGTGAPPVGPVDMLIENNRITEIDFKATGKLIAQSGVEERRWHGMYVLPGFVDAHAHVDTPADYVFQLWMGHGITTVRDP